MTLKRAASIGGRTRSFHSITSWLSGVPEQDRGEEGGMGESRGRLRAAGVRYRPIL